MKNIVICCDGTGNEISENISNVLKLYRTLRKTGKTTPYQAVYYDPGVGTLARPNVWKKLVQDASAIFGLATGYGLDDNLLAAWEFIVDNLRERVQQKPCFTSNARDYGSRRGGRDDGCGQFRASRLPPRCVTTRRANHFWFPEMRVKPLLQKYSDFQKTQITLYPSRPAPTEGRSRSSRTWGGMRWTSELRLTRVARAYGEIVSFWRPKLAPSS